MTKLLITPLSALEDAAKRYKPSHVLTLIDPDTPVATPKGIPPERHLRLGINDIVEPVDGHIEPASDHMARILRFASDWNREDPLLVHCWAGVSRSMAAAFTLLCDMHGPGAEQRIATGLRTRAPHAQPNKLMVRHADAILGRNGKMIAAVETMSPARIVWEGEIVELPISLDEL